MRLKPDGIATSADRKVGHFVPDHSRRGNGFFILQLHHAAQPLSPGQAQHNLPASHSPRMLSATEESLRDTDLTYKSSVSAACFLVWDTIIHIDEEVEHIWRAPRLWMNWVYAFVRHFPYVVQLIMISVTKAHTGVAWSAAGCHSWIVFQVAAMECVTVAVEIVLISRVYAMYNCNRAILTVLLLLFLAEIIAMIAIIVYSVPRASFITRWCLTTHAPNIFTLYWFISLAFESVLFAMTLVKLCSSISIGHSRRRSNHSSILFVLLRDGTWAFAVIFAVMLLNALMFRLVDNPLAGICFL
ncbi:hypothetical protein AcW1_006652 [Taiwanofungus camphoratus]|nr:hypothetical protein AcV5_009240 [Antrodia cinnamomea]KAI0924557.1 hypothetical protein AcW2_005414 [Antrodia cinnamomea]KAI0954083.1 hypothetical protein AcV7_007418 [Antrodia cinnamomea]KAI0954896.1 hypothetical protein AcW1_006652 [Antrodia cinnamomea]